MADKDKLCIFSSGACVPSDIKKDVLQSNKMGKEAKIAVIRKRLMKAENSEYGVPRLILKTMEKQTSR